MENPDSYGDLITGSDLLPEKDISDMQGQMEANQKLQKCGSWFVSFF